MVKINMRQMKVNQTGVISDVKAKGELGRRIRDLGIVKKAKIKIQGRAPLKDPVSLKIMGFTIILRNSEADYIDEEVN